jgi:hypothetical protein
MRIINRRTNLEIGEQELAIKMARKGSKIVYCDIECVLVDHDTGCAYILDECGNWDYIDTKKYKIVA